LNPKAEYESEKAKSRNNKNLADTKNVIQFEKLNLNLFISNVVHRLKLCLGSRLRLRLDGF
jgi:hypothetical protein